MPKRKGDALVVVGAAASAARVLRKDFSSRIMARVASESLRRGVHSGRRGWLYVAAAATGLRLVRQVVGRKEDVFAIKLRPGESIEIRERPRTK